MSRMTTMGATSDVFLGVGVAAVLGVAVFVVLSKQQQNATPKPSAQAPVTKSPPTAAATAATPTAPLTSSAPATAAAQAPTPAPAAATAAPTATAVPSSPLSGVAASAGPIAVAVGAGIAKDIGAKMADKMLAKLTGKNLARDLAQKVAQQAAQSASRCGIKAVSKMGVKLGTKLAEMGAQEAADASMGPVGWALMAFDVLSLGLDMADPGGYSNMQTLDMLYKQRDDLRTKAAAQGSFPFVVGPLTTLSDADSQALFQQVTEDYITDKLTDFVAGLDLANLTSDQLDAKLSSQEDTISDYLATDAGFAELFAAACVAKGGKAMGVDCSYPDADSCNKSYKWPMADDSQDIFTHWTGDHCESSAAQTVRKLCDDAGLDWDFGEEVCKLTQTYCLEKGADVTTNSKHGGATDCRIPWTQKGLEDIFGTTITRGLKQTFDMSQYTPCDPNTEWGVEQLPAPLKTFLNVSAPLLYMIPPLAVFSKLPDFWCFDKKVGSCPKGMEMSRGLCYIPCKDGYKSDGATLCYKQYDGWEQNDGTTITNVGKVLHANPGKPLSTCGSDQDKDGALCYPKCAANEYGVGPVCWTSCPDGYKDGGVFCSKPSSYGRGAGFPWKVGDKVGNYDQAKARCEKDNPGGCEKNGLIYYPLCKKSFHAVGCCVCSPDCPAGTTDAGATCTKNTHTRGAGSPLQCAAGQTQDSPGLCYDPCPAGTHKTTLGMCDSGCPDGAKDIGVSCMRESYDRGVGVIPWSMHPKKRLAPYGHK